MKKHIFKHLYITGGFLSGFHFDFSDNLNCIIGARGAGKTTVLEFIRYAMDVFPLNTFARKKLEAIVENNLEGGRIEVTVDAADGQTYIISRKRGEAPQVFYSNHEPTGMTYTPNLFPVDIFSQNEIEGIASQSSYQMALLESFSQGEITVLNSKIKKLQMELKSNDAKLRPLQSRDSELSEELNTMSSVKRQLSELSMVADDNDVALNKEHHMKDLRKRELSYVESVEILYTDAESRINLLGKQIFGRLGMYDLSELDDSSNNDIVMRVRDDIVELNEALNAALADFMNTHKEKYDHLRELKTELAKRHQAQELNYLDLVEKSREEQERAAARRVVEDEYLRLKAADDEKKEIRVKISEVINERRTLKEELKNRIAERFQIRAGIADRINSELCPKIRVTVSQCSNKDAYRELVEKALKGAPIHYKKVAANIVSGLLPEALVRIILDSNMNRLIEDVKLNPDQAKVVIPMLKNADFLADLETVDIPDGVKIELNDHGTYKQTETLSTGQKCNAILPILLLDSERPLLIDQPEDNLDNEFVHNIIVESVKDVKTKRQLIFVTHNPNIPVLCDSEQMLVMESDGTAGHVRKSGSVDDCKLDIINILEGGEVAFKERQKRYAF